MVWVWKRLTSLGSDIMRRIKRAVCAAHIAGTEGYLGFDCCSSFSAPLGRLATPEEMQIRATIHTQTQTSLTPNSYRGFCKQFEKHRTCRDIEHVHFLRPFRVFFEGGAK